MTTELTRMRCVLGITYNQIEEVLGIKANSIRSVQCTAEEILVLTDDERIGWELPPESAIPTKRFKTYPIEFNDDDSVKEGKTLP